MACNHTCSSCARIESGEMCIESPFYKGDSETEEEPSLVLRILTDDNIDDILSSLNLEASGVYQQTSEMMLEFARIGDSVF